MSRIPSIDPSDLRDHADPERVERIWARVQADLPGAVPAVAARSFERGRPSRSLRPVLLFAAGLAVFAGGLVAGASLGVVDRAPIGRPQPDATLSDIFAAGSEPRSFLLPGGGRLVLQAESMVEVVEASEGSVKLRLLRGSASVDASELDVRVITGQALVTAPAGSSMLLRRSDNDVAVSVSAGSVEVTTPSGERQVLGRGDASTRIPIAVITATHDPVALDDLPRSITPRDPSLPHAVSAVDPVDGTPTSPEAPPVAPLATWLSQYQSSDSEKAPQVSAQELEAAIVQAQSARDLMALSDIAQWNKRGDLAMRALRRVTDEFGANPLAFEAAFSLSRAYASAGNHELASKYGELAKGSSGLGETVLCVEVRSLNGMAPDPAERERAERKATEYLAKFADGSCAADARAVLDDVQAAGGKPDPKNDAGTMPDKPGADAGVDDSGAAKAPASAAPAKPDPKSAPKPSAAPATSAPPKPTPSAPSPKAPPAP